jgi:hypothetical protein
MRQFCVLICLLGVASLRAVGCVCGPIAFQPTCARVGTAEVVFIGVPTRIEKNYRFDIEKAYKGLDLRAKTVNLIPGFGDCGTEFSSGRRYIVFARRLEKSGDLVSGGCDGSRLADENAEDLRFLEAFAQSKFPTTISGAVLQVYSMLFPWKGNPGVPSASVAITDGSRRFTTSSAADGTFHFEGISPGHYLVIADREGYGPQASAISVDVTVGACAEALPVLPSNASVSGTVFNADGTPASKSRVETLRRVPNTGEWNSDWTNWTTTDSSGRFEFKGIPTGDYLWGHEIWSDHPGHFEPVPTIYYPSAHSRQNARIIHVNPSEKLTDLVLKLDRPHTPRQITVEVVWQDGRRLTEHLLQITIDDELAANVPGMMSHGAKHDGIATFTGFEERTHKLGARYWVDDLDDHSKPVNEKLIALADEVDLSPGKGPAKVRLLLTRLMRESDEKH